MREKFSRFMEGRYGQDDLSRCLSVVTLILIALSFIFRLSILSFLPLALLIYIYFRMFSKNIYARSAENQKFLSFTEGIRSRFAREKRMADDRKTNRIFKCPNCKQKIRVPKGKGKICITCPKCRTEFTRKS